MISLWLLGYVMYVLITSADEVEGGYVFGPVCLSVCLFVCVFVCQQPTAHNFDAMSFKFSDKFRLCLE